VRFLIPKPCFMSRRGGFGAYSLLASPFGTITLGEMALLRLQKILSAAGVASRREAELLIEDGDITVNGVVAKVGDKADPESDHIKVRGKLLGKAENKVVIALYKPRDVWCTTRPLTEEDPVQKATVFDMIPKIKERVLPVGKLDRDTEGILLMTNDGELSRRLLDAQFEVPKVWRFKIDGHVEEKKLKYLTNGMKLEGKRLKVSDYKIEKLLDGKIWVKLDTTEVQNRLLRKAFEKLGHPVDKAQRISFAGISCSEMERGQYRYLNADEIKGLKAWVGLKKEPHKRHS
jgi:23S rRNA pseudouridine2605 synthase